ncbi:hypothetical protein HMPREF1146_0075 [Prevotella sp. MSX73]|uniref:Uncharacterized protein n=1 Tax=Segatella buccae ATCC 33574 TaxID=873513 RepID=E6KAN0_9BACT|nr:hypothetical protein HMPREF6485_2666 [Segatella buccae ATCC 33574]EJP30366.1 hypothetical protein HMPREF1146_0075 [Prevotella sp. MSX73]
MFGIVLSWFKSFFSGVKENFLSEVKAAKRVGIRSARQEKWLEHKRKKTTALWPDLHRTSCSYRTCRPAN